MATTLINTPPNIPAILNNVNVHQTGLLDARRINFTFNRNYRNLFISYNNQKMLHGKHKKVNQSFVQATAH